MNKLQNFDNKLFLTIYNNVGFKKLFIKITKISKPVFILFYVSLLLTLFLNSDFDILKICIIKPFIVIVISKILRKKIGRKRPYEIFSEINLPKKEDASFPSNHTASSFIIALMFFYFNFEIAIVMIILAFIVSVSRIIVGLHFPLDIFFGALISITIYSIF